MDFSRFLLKNCFDLTFPDFQMSLQKVSKSDFQSQFSMSKFIQIFKSTYFFVIDIFLIILTFEIGILFSKMIPHF